MGVKFNKKLSYRWQTERRVWRSDKVTKHGTIRNVRYGFLQACYSNLVPTTRHFFKIFDYKNAWPWKPVRDPSMSLEMSPFDRAHI